MLWEYFPVPHILGQDGNRAWVYCLPHEIQVPTELETPHEDTWKSNFCMWRLQEDVHFKASFQKDEVKRQATCTVTSGDVSQDTSYVGDEELLHFAGKYVVNYIDHMHTSPFNLSSTY